MTAGHDELQVLMGAYVLGGLSEADHAAFAEHLRECRECHTNLAAPKDAANFACGKPAKKGGK